MSRKLSIFSAQKLLAALYLFPVFTLLIMSPGTSDTALWIEWANNISSHGLIKGYALSNDVYPPLYFIYLYLSSLIANTLNISIFFGIKTTSFISLLVCILIVYRKSSHNTVITTISAIPLLYTNISLLYLGIYYVPFLFLSMHYLNNNKIARSIFFFTIASLIKPQPLVIAPFLLIYLVNHYNKKSNNIFSALGETLLVLLPIVIAIYLLTYIMFGSPFLNAFFMGFQEPNLTYQALNLNHILAKLYSDRPKQELINTATLIFLFFFSSTIIAFFLRKKNFESLLLFCILGNFSYFMFSKGVHENHLYLSLVTSIYLSCINKEYTPLMILLTSIHCINLFVFYGALGTPIHVISILTIYEHYRSISFAQHPIELPFSLLSIISSFNVLSFLTIWAATLLPQSSREKKSA